MKRLPLDIYLEYLSDDGDDDDDGDDNIGRNEKHDTVFPWKVKHNTWNRRISGNGVAFFHDTIFRRDLVCSNCFFIIVLVVLVVADINLTSIPIFWKGQQVVVVQKQDLENKIFREFHVFLVFFEVPLSIKGKKEK